MIDYFNPPCVIFDIDGTLANIEHRVHFVRTNPKNWKAFSTGIKYDSVNLDIVWMLKSFRSQGSQILIASGRGEEDRAATVEWLNYKAELKNCYEKLYMRAANDTRPDNIVKGEILDQMMQDGYNPTIAVDDRDQVVAMWRARGLRCLQVDYGNF